jgi:hypothetical protein
MLQTYKAVLRGNWLEWIGAVPEQIKDEDELTVEVTILGDAWAESVEKERGLKMAEALEALAEVNALAGITDPVAWQREIREDRPLPGRE